MKLLRDYQGLVVRLTDERLDHIEKRPEMIGFEVSIEETLGHPERVIRSLSDDQVRLYYRFYPVTRVTAKFLCVVVKSERDDSFVVTAYLTERVKKGEVLWPAKS